jgi:hypothetical protein
MKIKKYSITILSLSLLLLSCSKSETIVRPAYSHYSLGMSFNNANDIFLHDLATGKFKLKYMHGERLVYEVNEADNGRDYYSSLIFDVPTQDTVIQGITIVYSSTNDDNLLRLYDDVATGNLPRSSAIPNDGSTINDHDITKDLISKISTSRGGYIMTMDTTHPDGSFTRVYKWENKNDVDITLTYNGGYIHTTNQSFPKYSITVEYRYTQEMLAKFNLRKSQY